MLKLADIDTFRGPAHILRSISLDVNAEEVVCLVGRNGAGKTTTIDTIMGYLPPASGKLTFQDRDITELTTGMRVRLGIGYSPDDCGIFPELSVAENLAIAGWIAAERTPGTKGGDEDRLFSVFPEVKDLTARMGLNLSGGQKKMVSITRAIGLAPSLLILDEPFEGLSPIVVTRFIEAVQKIKEMGISLLIAVSNLTTASRIADRLYAIDRGEIIYHGLPQDALQDQALLKTVRG